MTEDDDLEKLCEQGLKYLLGEEQAKDIKKAQQFFENAAKRGSLLGHALLGDLYRFGDIF